MHIFSIGVREVQQAQSSTTRIANKISSGNRLHKLGFDSAGFSVSSRQKSDVRSLKMASRNIQDGMNLVDTMASTLISMKNLLVRCRELAVQSSNDTYTSDNRNKMNAEFQSLLQEFEKQTDLASWNNTSILASSTFEFKLQIGKDNSSSSQLVIGLADYNSILANIGTDSGTLEVTMNNGIATRSTANEALKDLDQALENTDVKLSFLGSIQDQLKHALDNNYETSKNATISAGRISDTDYAIESAEITKIKSYYRQEVLL